MRSWQEPTSAGGVPSHSNTKLRSQEHEAATRQGTELPWVACPEADCDNVAEVVDRFTLQSTDGPVHMMRTRCIARHNRDSVV